MAKVFNFANNEVVDKQRSKTVQTDFKIYDIVVVVANNKEVSKLN